MNNPIGKVGMVAMPDSWEDIERFIDASDNPGMSTVIALMVWNFASKTVDDAMEDSE